jgi:TRAP-type mannitol/chloroaromatic compound transport system permease large subunit
VPTRVIFRGVLPFMTVDCVRLAILVAFPILSLWLPSFMR